MAQMENVLPFWLGLRMRYKDFWVDLEVGINIFDTKLLEQVEVLMDWQVDIARLWWTKDNWIWNQEKNEQEMLLLYGLDRKFILGEGVYNEFS